jgi:hypothetical protein
MNTLLLTIKMVYLIKFLKHETMSDLEVLENIGTAAVMQLRKNELAAGNPFMIYSKGLPPVHGYLEYPDGSIDIVTIAPNARSFVTVRKLSAAEAQAVRNQFNLL